MLQFNIASRFLSFCFFGGSWSWSGSSATPSAGTMTEATAGSSVRGSTAGTSTTRGSSATRATASSLAIM